MNGVRRFLGGGGGQRSQSPPTVAQAAADQPFQKTAPLALSNKPLWPPTPLSDSSMNEPMSTRSNSTSSSTILAQPSSYVNGPQSRWNGSRQNSVDDSARTHSRGSSAASAPAHRLASPGSSPSTRAQSLALSNAPSSPSRPLPSRVAQLKAWKRASGPMDAKDELLISLLASEAMLDSRDLDILSAEDVEELKKEHQILQVRLDAMEKKLQLETRIRDAAASLAKVNSAHKNVSKRSSEQLEAANRKVENVQKDLWRLSERTNEISKKLLEHRAGVLSFQLKAMETKASDADDSTYSASFRSAQMSPTLSETSYASSKTRFEGPHFFAGHEMAVPPMSPRKPPSAAEVSLMEARVKELNGKLQSETDAKAEAQREVNMLKVELEGLETSLTLELQAAEDQIASMTQEVDRIPSLEHQLDELVAARDLVIQQRNAKQREIDTLEKRLELLEEKSGEAVGAQMRNVELESALGSLGNALRSMNKNVSANASPSELISIVVSYLNDMQLKQDSGASKEKDWEAARLTYENAIRQHEEKQALLTKEVEEIRSARDKAQRQARELEVALQERPPVPEVATRVISYDDSPPDVKELIDALKPIWNFLPSPESRASKFGKRQRSPVSGPNSPNASLSELDVKLLKTLYDGRPTYQTVDTSSQFTIEGFVARVQALIADDRMLIERLVRLAQAHDMLKRNAERAQKIAHDSSIALETYQKQVKALEDRNLTLTSSVGTLQTEIAELHEAIEKATAEKRDVESQAAEQAETCRQLTEANNALSAKTLSLAQEAASAPEAIRSQLEKQLSDCKAELQKAQDDIHAMRTAEASQNIALLDELNHLQSDNENLRAQLRATQTKGKK